MSAALLVLMVLGTPCEGREVVAIAIDPRIESAFADDISVELVPAVRRLGATPCLAGSAVASARVTVTHIDETHMRITVENVDSERSAQREVALDAVPTDMRGLTIAQLAEEMLRGSWWSIIHPPAPEPLVAPPPPPEEAPPTAAATTRPQFALNAGFRVVAYNGDTRFYGPQLGVRWMPTPLIRLTLEGGYGVLGSLDAANGEVTGSLPWSAIAAGVAYATSPRFEVSVDVVGRGGVLSARGRPDAGATGARASGGTLEMGGRIMAARALFAGLGIVVSAEGGAVARAVDIRDAGLTVASMSGAYLAGTLGLNWVFDR